MTEQNITDFFDTAESIVIYNESNAITFNKDEKEYADILNILNESTHNSHEMPAYGVSLDQDTREAIKKGVWIELVYTNTLYHNDMPFDSLLIQVDSMFTGINLIRKHDNMYEGRCYYLDLNNNLSILYEKITTLI